MNIGIFTDAYLPQINGVVTSITMLEYELIKRGHHVTIITTSDPQVVEESEHIIRLPSIPFITSQSHRMVTNYPSKIREGLKALNFDIIHTHTEFPIGILGSILAKEKNIPHVHTYHTSYEGYLKFFAKIKNVPDMLARKYSKFFCQLTDHIIVPSTKTEKMLLTYKIKKPMSIIPTGIDFSIFTPHNEVTAEKEIIRKAYGFKMEDQVLLSVSRVSFEKSLDVIIRSMPKIVSVNPLVKLVFIGNGPALESLKALAKELHMERNVVFFGAIPWEEVPKHYRAADLFVSASQFETQGLTHLEAMAAHTRACMRRDPSFENIITHQETGYFFEDDASAADSILHAIDDPEKDRIIENGLIKIQPFSADFFAGHVEEVYNQVLTTSADISKKRSRIFKNI